MTCSTGSTRSPSPAGPPPPWPRPPPASNAAFVRLDIKRRDVLTGTITSPLLDMIKSGTPATERDTAELPTALDLPQVAASEVTPIRPTPLKRPDHPRTPAPASPPAPAASDGSDITDWI